MNLLPPRDVIALKVSLPFAQEAGKPFDPPLLVSAIGARFPVNSDDLYLARITLVRIGQVNITRCKESTEMVLEGNLEVGLTTELDGMLFFRFDQKAPGTLKQLQLGDWTSGESYRFAIQVFTCRLKPDQQGHRWIQGQVLGEVLTDEVLSVACSSIRRNPAMASPDRLLSEAIAGMSITNASIGVSEMKKRYPAGGHHADIFKGPWRSMGQKK